MLHARASRDLTWKKKASVGTCNLARPGMWASAEDKAKYEAWKKLSNVSRAEAMHLFVQAIEVFDAEWMQWEGLRAALQPNGEHEGAAAAAAAPPPPLAALAALKELRLGLAKLPAAELGAVRA